MAVVPTAFAIVMAAFGVESAAVGGGIHGDAECDGGERRRQ